MPISLAGQFARLMLLPAFLAAGLVPAQAQVVARWVQMAPGGVAEVRAVTGAPTCPKVDVDGAALAMRVRAPADKDFPLLCALTLPKTAQHIAVEGAVLPAPKAKPARLVVLGDTGCRIKGLAVQDCNDPALWPFGQVAHAAAATKPDLVLHVGDYLYREAPCPLARAAACGGTPWGDNWATWNADFFTPAAPLLAAAPFVFVRGNHEECVRSGPGWLRLLGPLPFDPGAQCTDHVAPYAVPLDGVTLAVFDDAHASDTDAPDDQVAIYRSELEAVAKLAPAPVFLAMHRPIWGVVRLGFGMVVGGNQTMMAAQEPHGVAPNVSLMLAGHIHTFEAMDYTSGAPPQILAGEGGDLLDAAPADLSGQSVGALKIASGISLPGYGFLDFDRNPDASWTVRVLSNDGMLERTCRYADRHVACSAKP